jgi:DNA-binding response OmpR family regulator
MILSFDDCEIDLERREFRRAGTAVHVEPQVFDNTHLAQNGDRVVSKMKSSPRSGKAGSSRIRR